MPTLIGNPTKTNILKSESHKLANEFEVEKNKGTVELSADLASGDKVDISVNGEQISTVTFDTDHDNTMDLIKAAVDGLSTVESSELTDDTDNRDLTITPAKQDDNLIITASVNNTGSGTANASVSYDINTVYKGQPVKVTEDGKIQPLSSGDSPHLHLGYSLHNAVGGELATIFVRGYAVIMGLADADDTLAGPIKYAGWDSTNKRGKYSSSSVTADNAVGWALDEGDKDEEIRVLLAD